MSDDTTPPQPPEGVPAPPPPPPAYGSAPPPPPPPPAYGSAPPPYTGGPEAPVPPMPPAGAVPGVPYAAWPQRFLAWLIDNGPLIVVFLILDIALKGAGEALGILIALGWAVYNYGIQQGTTGYTLGKGIIGIKLVSETTGQPVGTGPAIGRYFVHILDSIPCYIGFLWPLWDAKRQTFADKILTQIVIEAPKS